MPELLELIAVLACTLFAGAAIYITVAEHPARLACGTEIAATEFAPSYKRAAVMQVFLAATATLAGLARGWIGGGTLWLVASALIFAVIPFTLIAILPTNTRLLDPVRDRTSPETRELLEKWGRLHAVRSVLSLVAAVLFVWAAVRGPVSTLRGARTLHRALTHLSHSSHPSHPEEAIDQAVARSFPPSATSAPGRSRHRA